MDLSLIVRFSVFTNDQAFVGHPVRAWHHWGNSRTRSTWFCWTFRWTCLRSLASFVGHLPWVGVGPTWLSRLCLKFPRTNVSFNGHYKRRIWQCSKYNYYLLSRMFQMNALFIGHWVRVAWRSLICSHDWPRDIIAKQTTFIVIDSDWSKCRQREREASCLVPCVTVSTLSTRESRDWVSMRMSGGCSPSITPDIWVLRMLQATRTFHWVHIW